MSAPETNVKRQARRHRPPLIGIGLVLAFAAVAMFIWLAWEASEGNTPGEDSVVIDTEEVAPGVAVEETVPADEVVPDIDEN